MLLYAAAAGKCSFYGCPKRVDRELLTDEPSNLANVAHIVADSEKGPRGDFDLEMKLRGELENLTLMCIEHHNFIDKRENWKAYSVPVLREMKQRHEQRMRRLTDLHEDAVTNCLNLSGTVRGKSHEASEAAIRRAVFVNEERYVKNVIQANLHTISDEMGGYWDLIFQSIDRTLKEEVLPRIKRGEVERLSVFGLARIPALFYAGFKIGDKVQVEFYQKHKIDDIGWNWPSEDEIDFDHSVIQEGTSKEEVGVVVSISGDRFLENAVTQMAGKRIYQLAPLDVDLGYDILNSRQSLEKFRQSYRQLLSKLESEGCKKIHLFIAGPASVAFVCGRELRAEDPEVSIYDAIDGAYQLIRNVNE